MSATYARVAVPVPLGQAFSYLVPAEVRVAPGDRVLCEFGRRKVLGVVLDVSGEAPDVPEAKLKPILRVVDAEPPLPEELLEFLVELGRYYLAPIGEVMRMALPSVARTDLEALKSDGALGGARVASVGKLVQVAVPTGTTPEAPLRGQARDVLALLAERGPQPIAELERRWGNARAAVQRLVDAGLALVERRETPSDSLDGGPVERDVPPELNAAQARAVSAITSALHARTWAGFLLDGVTASGKTEVYLHAAAHTLEHGGSAIVLVPEIALTPQLVGRFRARLGDSVAVLHSGLTPGERHRMWRALRSGQLRIAVGARSALFAPVRDLALICVDEEHDSSFKQEEGVRYHARDMALLRAHRAGAACVLGSATPSLASEVGVRRAQLTRLELPLRARKAAAMPSIEIIDLKQAGAGPSGDRLLTLPLHRALEETLERGGQAILFLNRRGFAPSVVCEGCGKPLECPNCSVALTLHRARTPRLECHYCEHWQAAPEHCPRCASDRLVEEGAGTEGVEARLIEAFPKARVARLDRDVAAGAKSERVLTKMRRGEIDILVGTQMVTKGHDLPRVTLVGVLNADAALTLPDFRAGERCFHLLVQVAGRAGRAEHPGRVIIQTRQPDHPAVRLASRHDVAAFVEYELEQRQELSYPPFSRLALVKLDAVKVEHAEREAQRLADVVRRAVKDGVQVLGPAPAPLARLRNRYRYRFMLRAAERRALRRGLLAVLRAGSDRRVRMAIDIDPMSML